MGHWGVKQCTSLTRALAGADAEAAWEQGLSILLEAGLNQSSDAGPEALTINHDGEQVNFYGAIQFAEGVHELTQDVLTVALRRVVEYRRLHALSDLKAMMSEGSFEGLLAHVDGDVFHVNQRLAKIVGYEPQELLGPGIIQKIVHPEDQRDVFKRVSEGYEGSYVIRGVRKDGTVFPVELQSKQSRLGDRPVRVVAVRDVTEREGTMRLLRESEQSFRQLTDAVFDLTVHSRGGVMTGLRGPLIERMGYTPNDLIGRSILEIVAPSATPLTREQIASETVGSYETVLIDAQGNHVPAEIVAIYASIDGSSTRIAGIRDLRESRRMDLERLQLQERVERAQRLDSLGLLAGGIAHDFNNLLVSILGNAEYLRETDPDPSHIDMLDAILVAAERAAELTSRLLAYTGRAEMRTPEAVLVSDLVDDVRRIITGHRGPDAGAVPTLEQHLCEECRVYGERTTLTQVLLNLFANARDAMPNGGILTVRASRVTHPDERWDRALGATVFPGKWIQLEVSDTGTGMTEATLGRIFEPFYSTKPTGHGLGLAATLGIVTAHKGALAVTSTPGKGTHFSILLPEATEGAPSSSPPEATESWNVLIVDDERMVRDQLKRSLRRRGHRVTDVDSGISCLAQLSENRFDVVLLDVAMPGMDGAEVVAKVRARSDTTPIVLMSGYVNPDQEQRLRKETFQGFVRKPYGIVELLSTLRRAMKMAN